MNAIPISYEAQVMVCNYPFIHLRSDMGNQEYTRYKRDWHIFDKVWAYNYTIRALNNLGTTLYSYYTFSSNDELNSYINGQLSHVAAYPEAAAGNVFNNIP